MSHVEHHGKEAVDRLGLGLMQPIDSTASLAGSIASPEQAAQELEGEREDLREEAQEDREVEEGDGFEDIDSDVEEASRRKKPKLPAIKIGTGAKKGLRQLFGRRRGSSPSPSAAEEGRVPTDLSLLSPPTSFDPRAQPKPTAISGDNDHSLTLTRTTSASRTIRFADASSKSSNSAPGKKNYGAMNPNFKGNPSLAMTRAASIESMDLQGEEGPSVSFKEPDKRR